MKVLGIILIVAGILMFVFKGVVFTKKEKVLDVGPVEINKNEKKRVDWPVYAGAIVTIMGVVVLVTSSKKRLT